VTRWTIDASVAVKWFIPEIHTEAAGAWFDLDYDLMVPDLIYAEIGNILWKKFRHDELSSKEAEAVCQGIAAVPFRVWPAKELLGVALDLAMALNRTVYDCIYLAVAIGLDAPLVTADRKLFRSIKAGPFATHVHWLEEKLPARRS